MKKFLLLLNITIITFALNAQDLVISGKIVEQSSDEPLQYATIGIYNSSDSLSPIANAVSDLEGDFSFVSLFLEIITLKFRLSDLKQKGSIQFI